MKALIDGDILRYEIGYAAETGWKAITDREEIPPFDYVEDLLSQRIASILAATQTDEYILYITEGRTFRYDISKTRVYKGQRPDKKPWHFSNLTAYMKGVLPCAITTKIEADDAMAIESVVGKTIICSRDKDLRQVPGLFYSWELGRQPSFGPVEITNPGNLTLSHDKKKILGTGFAFFCSQMLTGDRADNIPGVEGIGPVAAIKKFQDCVTCEDYWQVVEECYEEIHPDYLVEQGQLLWIVRRFNPDGTPELWRKGLYA